jgi:hypothetical protein
MEVVMSSVQVTGIASEIWKAFRRLCLEEGISANQKLRQLIESQVALASGKEQQTQPIGTEK